MMHIYKWSNIRAIGNYYRKWSLFKNAKI